MTLDIDIWRSANVLVKQHGEDASIQAAIGAGEGTEDVAKAYLRSIIRKYAVELACQ